MSVLLEYPGEFTATFDATLAPSLQGTGMELCGTEGRLLVVNRRFEFHPVAKGERPVITEETGDSTADHVNNFIDCVRSRKLPNADVLIGHRSAQASHWAISPMSRRGGSNSTRCARRSCRCRPGLGSILLTYWKIRL